MKSQNIQAIAGLHEALKWWLSNTDAIRQKEKENHKRLFDLLSQYSFIKIVGSKNLENTIGVISCLFDNYTADEIYAAIDRIEERFGRNKIKVGFTNKDVPNKQGFMTSPTMIY